LHGKIQVLYEYEVLNEKYNSLGFTEIADMRGPYTDLNGIPIVPFPAQYRRISNVLVLITMVNDFVIALLTPPASSAMLKLFSTIFPCMKRKPTLMPHSDHNFKYAISKFL